MDINEDQQDRLIGKMVREYGHEQLPSDFTQEVLERLAHETKAANVKYGPLIPVWVWMIIACIIGMLVAGVLGGMLPGNITALDAFDMHFTYLERLLSSPNTLEISSPFVYGTLSLVFFVYLQLFLLRNMHMMRRPGW